MQTNKSYDVLELGIMHPERTSVDTLYAGQVGYLITGMKTISEARVGDTICHRNQRIELFPGFKPVKPMVFAGIYPISSEDFELLANAVEKLVLNDTSVKVEKKS